MVEGKTKRFSANMQQVYRKTLIRKCNLKKVAIAEHASVREGAPSNISTVK